MQNTQSLRVKKNDFNAIALHQVADTPLEDGQIRLRIELFALTANNITYAAFGDGMGYWNFFPQQDASLGLIPVWGFGRVSESRAEGIDVGALYYGYYPMASSVVFTPSHITPRAFVDSPPNRANLAPLYNQYVSSTADPYFATTSQALLSIYRPLFITSWLIDDFFAEANFFGADTLILSSASSKTAYGTAFALKARGVKLIGLSSASNLQFCKSLELYDQVLPYDALEQIPADTRCAYIDFAGNAALRKQIHERFTQLAYSASIGGTHVESLGGAKGLPGPKAELFFAPSQAKKRMTDWGPKEFGDRVLKSFTQFVAAATRGEEPQHWLRVQTHEGADAALAAYALVLKGRGDPRLGHVIRL